VAVGRNLRSCSYTVRPRRTTVTVNAPVSSSAQLRDAMTPAQWFRQKYVVTHVVSAHSTTRMRAPSIHGYDAETILTAVVPNQRLRQMVIAVIAFNACPIRREIERGDEDALGPTISTANRR